MRFIKMLMLVCILGSSFTDAKRGRVSGDPDSRDPGRSYSGKTTVIKRTTVVRRPNPVVVAPPVAVSRPVVVAPPIVIPENYQPYIGPVVNVNPFMTSNKPPIRPTSCDRMPQGVINVYRISD